MEAREERGLLIAATSRLSRKGGVWLVPSQTGSGAKYTVCPDPEHPHCTCPDHETRGVKCKHIFAVEYAQKRDHDADGTPQVTTEITITEKCRPTYPQNWKAYNAAQTHEKEKFLSLLHDLCAGVRESIPERPRKGRPPVPLADAIFAACYKVYSTFSGRRFMSDMRESKAKGYVSQCPHFNTIFNYLENPEVTPILKRLIVETSLPLKAVEVDFALDSSGFSTSRFNRWYDEKYGKLHEHRHWVKIHLMTGVKTNVVTSVELTDGDGADSPYLPPMVRETAQNFRLRDVTADKGYLSVDNVETIDEFGGRAFIPFKNNSTGASESRDDLWKKCFHYFSFKRDEFLRHYHKRSNVESTFSMIKAKFGDAVRSKTDTAMRNEILCKILSHNICRLIHAMYELGIEPSFWAELAPAQQVTG